MPIYEIEQYELHGVTYRVEADSEAAAIDELFAGKAEQVCDSQEFIQTADDFGLPIEEYRDLAEALRALGVSLDDDVIPSIRSIRRVNARTAARQGTARKTSGAAGEDDRTNESNRRYILYDPDADILPSARVYPDYEEAAADASRLSGVLIVPLEFEAVTGGHTPEQREP